MVLEIQLAVITGYNKVLNIAKITGQCGFNDSYDNLDSTVLEIAFTTCMDSIALEIVKITGYNKAFRDYYRQLGFRGIATITMITGYYKALEIAKVTRKYGFRDS